jgi:hypothetical protein
MNNPTAVDGGKGIQWEIIASFNSEDAHKWQQMQLQEGR